MIKMRMVCKSLKARNEALSSLGFMDYHEVARIEEIPYLQTSDMLMKKRLGNTLTVEFKTDAPDTVRDWLKKNKGVRLQVRMWR